MTTPNIKALAEKIKRIGDREKTRFIQWRPNNAYLLASALLRVMEDAERLKKALITLRGVDEALESHNKLMEELGGE
jgi:hypothetical protein